MIEPLTVDCTEFPTPRHLVQLDLHRLPHVFTDALVIGSGAAGLSAAIELGKSRGVLLVTKGSLQESATEKAQGGIAIAVASAGGKDGHTADTIAAGDGLCDEEIVRFIVDQGPDTISELVKWGGQFDREGAELALTLEGGHSGARIVHACGDATGRELERCLIDRCRGSSSVDVMENCFVVDLVTDREACFGALLFDSRGEFKLIRAAVTIVATGGCGRIYRESTAPDVCTGDGMAIGYRAGARMRDMAFVQFHPTTLYVAGAARALISEVLRGEGGVLLDGKGRRFMKDYHPDGELASRDIVCRGVLNQMHKDNNTNVFLDITHLSREVIDRRFPSIRVLCERFDIDIAKDPIPVRPSAHYMMGGIETDREGRSGIEGLYVCGEAACIGFHGANRLGSNSLLEALVMGRTAGRAAAEEIENVELRDFAHLSYRKMRKTMRNGLDIGDVRNSLQSLMTRNVGIERSSAGLQMAEERLKFWENYVMEREFENPEGWELQNMLTVAGLIVKAASMRRESRGAHYRLDFPETADKWARHICIVRPNSGRG